VNGTLSFRVVEGKDGPRLQIELGGFSKEKNLEGRQGREVPAPAEIKPSPLSYMTIDGSNRVAAKGLVSLVPGVSWTSKSGWIQSLAPCFLVRAEERVGIGANGRVCPGSLSGGDWRWINWYSPYVEPVREGYAKYSNEWGCKDEQKCIELRSASRKKVHSLKSIDEIFSLTPMCFHYDPISYAKFIDQPVLMFTGVFDKVIPPQASNGFYRLLPNAKKISVPSGHKSSYLFRRFIGRASVKFLRDCLIKNRSQNANLNIV